MSRPYLGGSAGFTGSCSVCSSFPQATSNSSGSVHGLAGRTKHFHTYSTAHYPRIVLKSKEEDSSWACLPPITTNENTHWCTRQCVWMSMEHLKRRHKLENHKISHHHHHRRRRRRRHHRYHPSSATVTLGGEVLPFASYHISWMRREEFPLPFLTDLFGFPCIINNMYVSGPIWISKACLLFRHPGQNQSTDVFDNDIEYSSCVISYGAFERWMSMLHYAAMNIQLPRTSSGHSQHQSSFNDQTIGGKSRTSHHLARCASARPGILRQLWGPTSKRDMPQTCGG